MSLIFINKANFKTRRNHVKQVKEQINKRKCPRCGAELVIRSGKKETFYGCKSCPKCRYTVLRVIKFKSEVKERLKWQQYVLYVGIKLVGLN